MVEFKEFRDPLCKFWRRGGRYVSLAAYGCLPSSDKKELREHIFGGCWSCATRLTILHHSGHRAAARPCRGLMLERKRRLIMLWVIYGLTLDEIVQALPGEQTKRLVRKMQRMLQSPISVPAYCDHTPPLFGFWYPYATSNVLSVILR